MLIFLKTCWLTFSVKKNTEDSNALVQLNKDLLGMIGGMKGSTNPKKVEKYIGQVNISTSSLVHYPEYVQRGFLFSYQQRKWCLVGDEFVEDIEHSKAGASEQTRWLQRKNQPCFSANSRRKQKLCLVFQDFYH